MLASTDDTMLPLTSFVLFNGCLPTSHMFSFMIFLSFSRSLTISSFVLHLSPDELFSVLNSVQSFYSLDSDQLVFISRVFSSLFISSPPSSFLNKRTPPPFYISPYSISSSPSSSYTSDPKVRSFHFPASPSVFKS